MQQSTYSCAGDATIRQRRSVPFLCIWRLKQSQSTWFDVELNEASFFGDPLHQMLNHCDL